MQYRLVVVRGRSAAPAITLGGGVTVAGRQGDCQLRIASSQVSRRHCQFFEQKGYLIVKDLGSSNGTFVNGKKIQGQRVLEDQDVLKIGPIEFRVEKTATPEAAGAAQTPGGGKKAADTAVGPAVAEPSDGAIPFDDAVIEIESEGSGGEVTAMPAAPTQAPQPSAAAEAETIELDEDDVADFLLEFDVEGDQTKPSK